jgi:hypothetical protein
MDNSERGGGGGQIMVIAPLSVRAPPCTRLQLSASEVLKFVVTYEWELPPLCTLWLPIGYDRELPPYTRAGFCGTTVRRGTIVKSECTKNFVVSPETL